MGGCRCTFRGCPNNTANSPGMHFFHYPLKNPERYDLWLKYADTKHFLDIPTSKARNKVVCETHFRDECFMNYKKERLVQFAVPTLVRLPNNMILDFEESECPKPKLLEPTKSKHLIRPNSDNSPTSSSAATRSTSSVQEQLVIEPIEDTQSFYTSGQKRTYCMLDKADKLSFEPKLVKLKAPKILNSTLPYYLASKAKKPAKVNSMSVVTRFPDEFVKSEAAFCEEFSIQSIEEHVEHLDDSKTDTVVESLEDETCMLNDQDEQQESLEPKEEVVSKSLYNEMIDDYESRIKELEEKIKQRDTAVKVRTTQVETVSTSRPPISNTSGALTKAQLFNGIKKYLSPSMAALVRMEMFGGPERQWKTDEKQVSVELLKLGETVFNYFRDEWRFRLPPKKDVQQWLAACDSLEEDEEL